MDEKPTDGNAGSVSPASEGADEQRFKVDALDLGKMMIRKLFNAAMTGRHSLNQEMDKQEAGQQLLELAADAVASVDRLFLEKQFDANEAGFASIEAARQVVAIASSATIMIESMWRFYNGANCKNLSEVAADLEEFPVMNSGLRSVMAERTEMLQSLKLASKSPFKEDDGRRKGPGMADDMMRSLIKWTFVEIQTIRLHSAQLYRSNPELTETIKHLPTLTLDTYRRWASVMAEIASTWGGEEPALFSPGTWLHRLGSPESSTKRNWKKRVKPFERRGKPVPKLTPQEPSRADRKKLLAARIRDRLRHILKPLAQMPAAQINS